MNLECEHGQLARSCNICEYEREIAELNARVKAKWEHMTLWAVLIDWPQIYQEANDGR